MADSVTVYYTGNPALASYALLLDGDGVEIASTGNYVQGTGIALTNPDYTDNILRVDDIAIGDLVTAEVGFVDVYDSNDVKLIRFTLDPVLTLDHVEYTFVWPVGGIEFTFAPTVTTGVTTLITANSATCAGEVTDDGGGTISERGIAYGTSINPTIAGDHEAVAGTTGAFTADLANLVELTTYHYRAFATNEIGTSYGDDATFITTHATIPCVLGSILIPSYAHVYDQTGSYSFPWDWMRSKSRYSRLQGFCWQQNTSYSDNNISLRVREALGDANLCGQYCTPLKIYDPERTANGGGLWCPYTDAVATKYGANVENAYLHTASPATPENRKLQLNYTDAWWARFAHPDWLDYVFGKVDGSGKQTNGDDCWVVEKHFATDHHIKILCNDNLFQDSLANSWETEYTHYDDWCARLAEYLEAYQNRIIIPRGLKLAGNIGINHDAISYFEAIFDQLDIYFNEYMFCMPNGSASSTLHAWNTGALRIYEILEMLKYMIAAGKGVLLGQYWYPLPAWFTCAAGTGAIKVYATASGRALAVKHTSIDAGAYTDYLLADYSTINALITAVDSKFSGAITISQNMPTYGCDQWAGFDSPHKLATMAEATFTTTGTYLKAMEPSRYAWLTALCLGVLAGAGAESELYLGIESSAGATGWNSARERITDLINIPLGLPDPEMTDYERYPGETVTNIYYRKLLTVTGDVQAIAVLNWESSAKTVNASDFDLEYFIDPFTTYFTTNPVTVTPVATISLPKYSGTVLLTGAA